MGASVKKEKSNLFNGKVSTWKKRQKPANKGNKLYKKCYFCFSFILYINKHELFLQENMFYSFLVNRKVEKGITPSHGKQKKCQEKKHTCKITCKKQVKTWNAKVNRRKGKEVKS